MDGGNGVFCLVVADHLDFQLEGRHQGDNLAWSFHKRLAAAEELDFAGWVDHPHHSTGLSVEDHPIAGVIPSVSPAKDGDADGVDLRKDWAGSRREVWDFYQNPCLCAHP